MMNEDYRDSVMQWGNEKPWKKLPNLSHKGVVSPDEVVLDHEGNILEMPLLRKKPCFGRPETFLRHGKRVRRVKNHYGKFVDSSKHQCGLCPSLTRESCTKVVTQRVEGNPKIDAALSVWFRDCRRRHGGELVYTKESGKLWGAFKEAIADRGPFTNSNDQALLEEDRRAVAEQTAKWRHAKARQRARVKKDREQSSLRVQPTRQFIENVIDERNERQSALHAILGDPGQHKSRSNVRAGDREVTAAITANAWLVQEILRENAPEVGPGTIARRMVELGLNEGKSLATLKARMRADLSRGSYCLSDGVWNRFNRDRDLDAYQAPDDDAADSMSEPIDCTDDVIAWLAEPPNLTLNAV